MGLSYGIKQCRETLLYLSGDGEFNDRMSKAFSEIGVITSEDVSQEYFTQIKEWQKKYLSITNLTVFETDLTKKDNIDELKRLSNELVFICVDIIENNAQKIKKDQA